MIVNFIELQTFARAMTNHSLKYHLQIDTIINMFSVLLFFAVYAYFFTYRLQKETKNIFLHSLKDNFFFITATTEFHFDEKKNQWNSTETLCSPNKETDSIRFSSFRFQAKLVSS